MNQKNPIQVADRLFGALELLCTDGPLGLAEIATALDLNKSTAHRVLQSLQHLGYVRQNADGRYAAGFKIVGLANRVVSGTDAIALVRPWLRQLVDQTGETVHFVRREGNNCVYIDKIESTTNTVQMVSHAGSSVPMYCSGVGKAMTADLSDEDVALLWEHSDIQPRTPRTITDFDRFKQAIAEVRERGYAVDDEENELGVRCVAISLPLDELGGQYALSISAPIGRMGAERIAELAQSVLSVKKEFKARLS